jgi:hypothetical protein
VINEVEGTAHDLLKGRSVNDEMKGVWKEPTWPIERLVGEK